MDHVLYREPGHRYPIAARGEGVYLYDTEGKQYLDGSGGAAISCLGHGHPAVIRAIQKQSERMAFAHTTFFTNEAQETLAGKLAALFGVPGVRTYFVSGGSEANETALKLARQYWLAQGQPGKYKVISRRQSYHGNTLGALSVTGNFKRREPYQPLIHDWPRIDDCYAFRHQRAGEGAEAYGLRAADALLQAIAEHGAESISAFIAETVVGATLGAVPAVPGYFRRIREICDAHEILLILDEVMAGCGRTGSFFGFEQEGIKPDIVTLAKGLGGGYMPLGAAMAAPHVHEAITGELGGFSHGHTYVGHATACAAGLAVVSVIEEQGLLPVVQRQGEKLQAALGETFAQHPHVGDIRGRGLFRGIELVADRASNAPVSARLGVAVKLRHAAMEAGLVCYPCGGSFDGRDGAHILLAPPFILTDAHIDELCEKLHRAMQKIRFE